MPVLLFFTFCCTVCKSPPLDSVPREKNYCMSSKCAALKSNFLSSAYLRQGLSSCVFSFCQNSFTLVTFSAVSSLILSLGRCLLKIQVINYECPYYAVFLLLLSLSLSSQRFCSAHCSQISVGSFIRVGTSFTVVTQMKNCSFFIQIFKFLEKKNF